ncbi:MAG: permease [Actinobacteria bacterium]|nr:permease [Actinomycetota bacterium]
MSEGLAVARVSATLLAELVLLFVGVSFLFALARRRLGADRIRRWMGGGPLVGALKGVALGVVTPFCSYSTIPVLVGLLNAEVRLATAAAFVVASPLLDPLLLAVIALLFGPAPAAGYAAVTIAGSLLAALLADACLRRGLVAMAPTAALVTLVPRGVTEVTSDGCRAGDPGRPPPWRGMRAESREAWRSALATIRGLLPSVVAAVLLAVIVSLAVPPDVLGRVAGPGSTLAVPAAALLGVPLYVGAEALLPIGAALLDKGVGLGPLFAFLIAGAGVSVPEIGMLAGIIRPPFVAALVGVVFAVAVFGGLLIPLV